MEEQINGQVSGQVGGWSGGHVHVGVFSKYLVWWRGYQR